MELTILYFALGPLSGLQISALSFISADTAAENRSNFVLMGWVKSTAELHLDALGNGALACVAPGEAA